MSAFQVKMPRRPGNSVPAKSTIYVPALDAEGPKRQLCAQRCKGASLTGQGVSTGKDAEVTVKE